MGSWADLHQSHIVAPLGTRGQYAYGTGFEVWGHDGFDEAIGLDKDLGRFEIDRAIEAQHATKGAHRITIERFARSQGKLGTSSCPARIGCA